MAIETMYRGFKFRSRNEARWAAFFDGIDWKWEYEPFDGNGYIPDFAIHGPRPLLVEIKPDLDTRSLTKYNPRIEAAVVEQWESYTLIVGSTPLPHDTATWEWAPHRPSELALGIINQPASDQWSEGVAMWFACTECGTLTITQEYQARQWTPCDHPMTGDWGLRQSTSWLDPARIRDKIQRAWADATNAVQWRP